MESLSIRAEQALLGAVLCDPAGQRHLLDLVEPGDMRRPWHAQALRAMQRVRARRQLPGPLEVYKELQKDPDLPPSVARDGVPVAELMAAAPNPRHGESYACLVIEGGIRQRLHLAGSRLAQASETGDLEAALHQAAQASRELEQCSARWLGLPERLRREIPGLSRDEPHDAKTVPNVAAVRAENTKLHRHHLNGISALPPQHRAPLAPPLALAETSAASAQQGRRSGQRERGLARPRGPAAEAAGARALQDLAAGPSYLSQVRGWLRPEHFALAEDGELYAVMRDLNAAGKPVDPVTIAWEAARRGMDAAPVGLAGGSGAFAVASAREVHQHSMLAQAEQAGQDIHADAADATCSPLRLFQSARARLRALETQAQAQPHPRREARALTKPGREAAS